MDPLSPTNAQPSAQTGGFSALDGGLSSPSRSAGEAAIAVPVIPVQLTPNAGAALSNTSTPQPEVSKSNPFVGATGASSVDSSDLGDMKNLSSSSTRPGEAERRPSEKALVPTGEVTLDTSKDRDSTPLGTAADQVESRVSSGMQASSFVAPQSRDQQNDATAHVDNLVKGVAGVALTAPLAAVEKVSPVLAEKVQGVASTLSNKVQDVASGTGTQSGQGVTANASQTAQSLLDRAKEYLPASLGGTGTTQSASSTTGSGTSAGPTLTERASHAATSAKDSVASTAQAYLPASIAGGASGTNSNESHSTTKGSTGYEATSTSRAGESPYIAREDVQPTSTLSGPGVTPAQSEPISKDSSVNASEFRGLAPASFATSSASDSKNDRTSSSYDSGASLEGATTTDQKPTQGAPMYTGSQAGSSDFKKDQTDFAPAEYAAGKHKSGEDHDSTGAAFGGSSLGKSSSSSHAREGHGVGPDPETKDAKTIMTAGGGLGGTAESDVPASSTTSRREQGGPFADPKSGSAGLNDTARATDIGSSSSDATTGTGAAPHKSSLKVKLGKILH